jgi:hypothetical protein
MEKYEQEGDRFIESGKGERVRSYFPVHDPPL